MVDRRIYRKLKGKVLTSYIPPAYMCSLETMALAEKQQAKMQVCEHNWMRRIVGVKKADKRRKDELRVKTNLLKLVRHVEKMGDEKLAKKYMLRKWREKGDEEDRERDGRPALSGIMERVGREWRTTAKTTKKLETGDRERSERKVRRRKKRRRINDSNHGNLIPVDKDNKRRTT